MEFQADFENDRKLEQLYNNKIVKMYAPMTAKTGMTTTPG